MPTALLMIHVYFLILKLQSREIQHYGPYYKSTGIMFADKIKSLV